MNLVKMLRLLQWINEYISLKYCVYDSYWNKWVINKSYISDLAKFNNIIGRMELYVTDKKDKENAVYMLEWFKKEMDARDYIYDDFIEWAEEQENNLKTDVDAEQLKNNYRELKRIFHPYKGGNNEKFDYMMQWYNFRTQYGFDKDADRWADSGCATQ